MPLWGVGSFCFHLVMLIMSLLCLTKDLLLTPDKSIDTLKILKSIILVCEHDFFKKLQSNTVTTFFYYY